jgi:hypothetical protein
MDKSSEIRSEIRSLIATLSEPLEQEEISAGWTGQAQQAMLKLLGEIDHDIEAGNSLPKNLSIGRGLDHWGVEDGELFQRMCALSNCLREL